MGMAIHISGNTLELFYSYVPWTTQSPSSYRGRLILTGASGSRTDTIGTCGSTSVAFGSDFLFTFWFRAFLGATAGLFLRFIAFGLLFGVFFCVLRRGFSLVSGFCFIIFVFLVIFPRVPAVLHLNILRFRMVFPLLLFFLLLGLSFLLLLLFSASVLFIL